MAVIKIILFDSPSKQLKDGTFPISLKVTHQRKRKYFSLNRYCTIKQWNKDDGKFRKNYKHHSSENDALEAIKTKAQKIIRDFDRYNKDFSFNAFEMEFVGTSVGSGLKEAFERKIEEKIKEKKLGTAESYQSTLNVIIRFLKDTSKYTSTNFNLTDISFKFLTDLEHWLRAENNCKDTSIAVYMRTLRAIVNKAIKEKVIKREHYAFDEYSIAERLNIDTQKRAITKDTINKIKALVLPEEKNLKFARDIFLFSFYTRGMNFVDIAYLTPVNIVDGRLMYIRRKTKKPFNMKLLPQAQEIIDYYLANKETEGDFIFPVFNDAIHISDKQKYTRRKTVLKLINKKLKEVAGMIDIDNLKLTTYVSRHSYATVLKDSKVPTAVISEAMGHQTEQITQTYLKQFENKELDQADENLL